MAKTKKNKKKNKQPDTWLTPKRIILIILAAGFLAYAGSLSGSFVFDDELLIERNELIRSIGNIPQFFSGSIDSGAYISDGNFFRPIQMIAYTLIYSVFQLSSTLPYHLVSILVHTLNALMVYALIRNLKIKKEPALIGALLFLLHPVQTQAVAYISGLADPLGLMFMLSGLLLLFHSRFAKHKPVIRYIGALTLFLLAMLTKESFIIAGPLVLLFGVIHWRDKHDEEFKLRIAAVIAANLLSLCYIILKMTALNFSDSFGLAHTETAYSTNIWIRIATFLSVLWDYFVLLVFPKDLYYEKPLDTATSIQSLRGMFGVLVVLATMIASFVSIRTKNKRLLAAIGCIVIPIIPYTGIIPLNAYHLEHWLYVPMIGFAILAAYILDSVSHLEWLMTIAAVILVLLGLRTFTRAGVWGNPVEFYNNELIYNTESGRIYNNLANIYSKQGEYPRAIQMYEQAIELNDSYPQTRHNLGNAYALEGQYQEAFNQFYISLQLDPNFIYSHDKLQKLFTATEGEEERAAAFGRFVDRIRSGGSVSIEEINLVLGISETSQPQQ